VIQTLVESQSYPSEGYSWESTILNSCLNDFKSNFLPKLKPGSLQCFIISLLTALLIDLLIDYSKLGWKQQHA